jgi:hypothetical protein
LYVIRTLADGPIGGVYPTGVSDSEMLTPDSLIS